MYRWGEYRKNPREKYNNRKTNTYLILLFTRYFAHGTTTDYMYDIEKVPMPFTFEVSQFILYSD
jgi:hypothetical protein